MESFILILLLIMISESLGLLTGPTLLDTQVISTPVWYVKMDFTLDLTDSWSTQFRSLIKIARGESQYNDIGVQISGGNYYLVMEYAGAGSGTHYNWGAVNPYTTGQKFELTVTYGMAGGTFNMDTYIDGAIQSNGLYNNLGTAGSTVTFTLVSDGYSYPNSIYHNNFEFGYDSTPPPTSLQPTLSPTFEPTASPTRPRLPCHSIRVGQQPFACLLQSTGMIQCMGDGTDGRLGDGTEDNVGGVPVQVSGITTAVDMCVGSTHSCAVLSSGVIKCWGTGTSGQLGNGFDANALTPVQVSGISTAVNVTCGLAFTCALLSDGTVKCWGHNSFGQLGDNTKTRKNTPVSAGSLSGVLYIGASDGFTMCAATASDLYCWGNDNYYQTGTDIPGTDVVTPTVVGGPSLANIVYISGNSYTTCAVTGSGALYCWGNNERSVATADGSTISQTRPFLVTAVTDVKEVSIGLNQWTCTLKNDGTVQCWGTGSNGYLGNGFTSDYQTPQTVTGMTDALSISSGTQQTCVSRELGKVSCWGASNAYVTSSTTPLENTNVDCNSEPPAPTPQPTFAPSTSPTAAPSASPTAAPSASPTESPTFAPTASPTIASDLLIGPGVAFDTVSVNSEYVAACKLGVRCEVYNRSSIHTAPQSVFEVGVGYGSHVVMLEGGSLGISEDTENNLHFWHVDGTDTWTKVEAFEFQNFATPTFIDSGVNEHGNVTVFLDSVTRYLKVYDVNDGDATFVDGEVLTDPKSVAIMGPNGECLLVGDSNEASARVFRRVGNTYSLRLSTGSPGIATGAINVAAGKEHFAITNPDTLSGAGRLNVFKYDFATELTTTTNAMLDVFGENSTSSFGSLVSVSKIDDSIAVYETQRKMVFVYWLDGNGDYFLKYTAEYSNGISDLHIESKTVLFTVDAETGQITEHVRHDGTYHPSRSPTTSPTDAPTDTPTDAPTLAPSTSPTTSPTNTPSVSPTPAPTFEPFNVINMTQNTTIWTDDDDPWNSYEFGWKIAKSSDETVFVVAESGSGDSRRRDYHFYDSGDLSASLSTLSLNLLEDTLGNSIALSQDGTYFAMGFTGYNSARGGVRIHSNVGNSYDTLDDIAEPVTFQAGSGVLIELGHAVKFRGNDYLVASAIAGTGDLGAIYTFKRNDATGEWDELVLTYESGTQALGYGLSVEGDWMAAGELYGDIYLYKFESEHWVWKQTLSGQGTEFGHRIAMSSDATVLATSIADGTGGVYVYHRIGDTWTTGRFIPTPAGEFQSGKYDLAFHNTDTLFTWTSIEGGAGQVNRYSYYNSHWYLRETANTGSGSDRFGFNFEVVNDHLLVGVERDDASYTAMGSVHVFDIPQLSSTNSPSASPTDAPTPYTVTNHTVKKTIYGSDSFGLEVSGNDNGVIAVTYENGVKLFSVESFTNENSVLNELYNFTSQGGVRTPVFIGNGHTMVMGVNDGEMDVYTSDDGGEIWEKAFTVTDGEGYPGFANSIVACPGSNRFLVQSLGDVGAQIPSRIYTYDTNTITKIDTATIVSESLSLTAGTSMECGHNRMITQLKSTTRDRVRLFQWDPLAARWVLLRSMIQPNGYSEYGDKVMIMQNDGLIALSSSGVIDLYKTNDNGLLYSISSGGTDAHTSIAHDDEWLITNTDQTTLVRYDLTDGSATQVYSLSGFHHDVSLYISGLDTFVGNSYENKLSIIHDDVDPHTRAPTTSPPTPEPTPPVSGGRGELCVIDEDCEGTLVCNNYCSLPTTVCEEHSDCFATRVEGYLPECNFDSGECVNVKMSTCATQVSCASEAKTYEDVVNIQIVELANITNSSEVSEVIHQTASAIRSSANISDIRITSRATYQVNITVTNVTTHELERASKKIVCGDVNDQCTTEVSNRRTLSQNEEVISITLSFDLDEDAYKTLVDTGVKPDDQQFVELLAAELNIDPGLIELDEYLPDFFAVEVLVTERLSKLYDTAIETINTISDVVDDVINESVFSFNKQVTEQCPETKTCSYRGTCNPSTGVCDCDEGFTGLLCSTSEGTTPTVIHVDEFHIRVSNAHTEGTVKVGATATDEKRTVYYYYEDFNSLDDNECPQPTFDGNEIDDWGLVFARTISQTGGGSCVLQNFNQSKHTYICCFVRNLGMMPMYQYALDVNETSNGDSQSGVWYAIDRDGNSKQNTETRSPTASPTDAPTPEPTTNSPTDTPTDTPTPEPTNAPTDTPTDTPTPEPTNAPTDTPTDTPTPEPTTNSPTTSPTDTPTPAPTDATPTASPIVTPGVVTPKPTHDTSSSNDNTAGLAVFIISLLVPLSVAVVYLVGNTIINTSRRMRGHRPIPQHRPFDF